LVLVTTPSDPLPTDLAAAHAMILAQREQLTLAKSEVTVGRLEIERLKLMLAKARREQFGQSSERGKLLVEQLELAIEDLEETQAEQETKAEFVAPEAAKQKHAQNPRPARRPLPDNLPVERIVERMPCACGKCGSERLHKLGEVVSKTLECEPRRWKIIEHVREKFSCRDCEAITEAPAPSHPIPRGFAGPNLLAMVLVNKFLLHQPLNRQSKTYAREGIEIDVSTLADRVGACVVALDPIIEAIRIAAVLELTLDPVQITTRRRGHPADLLEVAGLGLRAFDRPKSEIQQAACRLRLYIKPVKVEFRCWHFAMPLVHPVVSATSVK
jgi:transposase